MNTRFQLIFLVATFAILLVGNQLCLAQGPSYWGFADGTGDGTDWFDQFNWFGPVPTGTGIFSNEQSAPLPAGAPDVTNPTFRSAEIDFLSVRSADVSIDFGGRLFDLKNIGLGDGDSNGGFCQLELQNIGLISDDIAIETADDEVNEVLRSDPVFGFETDLHIISAETCPTRTMTELDRAKPQRRKVQPV